MEEAMDLRSGRGGQADARLPAHRPQVAPAAAPASSNARPIAPAPDHARRRSRRARIVRLPVVARSVPGSSLSTEDGGSAPLVPFPQLAPLPEPSVRAGAAQPRILIVEDDARTARVLRQVLEVDGDPGWKIDVVGAGTAALAAALQSPPRVVLLDIGLPDLDGAEVYRRLRANARTADVRVIFLTGATSHDLSARGITEGVLLRKPFATRDLASIVRALLDA